MKLLCLKCEETMTIKKVAGSEDNSVAITFICQRCDNSFAMLTNPMETQLVKGLGVHVGGRKIPYKPMEVIKDTLLTKEEEQTPIMWDKDAEFRLENIPAFARPMAKVGIERYARERGCKRITLEVLADARRVYGM